ncbi:6666_t:CDS:2, partial [Funneliformis geosporum]
MSSGVNARESENAMCKTVKYLYDPNSGAKAMRIGYELLQQDKRVAFILTKSMFIMGYEWKTIKKGFFRYKYRLGELYCVAYINTVEAGISFEKTNHFDAVIGITNIVTPVNVEAFIQMMFQIYDCKK